MKILSFVFEGRPSFGIVNGERVSDIGRALQISDLGEALARFSMAELEDARSDSSDVALADVTFLPPIPRPKKIFCVGINYDAHRIETGRERPSHPVIFTRFAHTLVGHQQPLHRPRESERFDFEGEVAVIIGRGGRRIPEADAWAHVAGLSCFNDGSVRDFQRHTSQFTPGKNFDATGGFGPWLVTTDTFDLPLELDLETRVNGRVMQTGNTAQMTFPIPKLVAYLSTFATLAPGDVIATGTPAGVGDKRDPPVYLKAGDAVSVLISGIGQLANSVRDD